MLESVLVFVSVLGRGQLALHLASGRRAWRRGCCGASARSSPERALHTGASGARVCLALCRG